MKSRPLIIGIVSVVLLGSMCFCASAVGLFAYKSFGEQISSILADASELFDGRVVEAEEGVATETPLGADVDLGRLFDPFWESRLLIHDEFVEQPVDDEALAEGARESLLAELDLLGVDLEAISLPSSAASPESLSDEANTPDAVAEYYRDFWVVWGQAEFADLEGLITYEELMRAALRGMVAGLGDEHSAYLDPHDLLQSENSLQGEYEGIGAWVDPTTDYLTIVAPMEGSPAQAAGLRPGDRVIAIDGDDMTGIDGNAVISRILGSAGSLVVLTIDRDLVDMPFDVEIVREAIFVASVESELLDGDIAYLQLISFGAGSAGEVRSALEELMAEEPVGLIFDLRNNGGGFVDTAIDIASEFIEDGVVLYEEYGSGNRDAYRASGDGIATEIPMIILVNQGTASSSEIVAGAIQDMERGLLLGETSFGKGSVQTTPLLSNDQGALRITIAYWLTPDERQIHGIGLEPDVFVEFTQEQFDAGRDPQLDAAIELLSQ